MKVFAPKRMLFYKSMYDSDRQCNISVGLPIEGEWVDKDDYFRQVSSGNDINDVVHAKVVDANGIDYSVGDLTDSYGRLYPQSCWANGLWIHCASYENHEIKVWRLPKGYKGNKPIAPHQASEFYRTTHTALIRILGYDMNRRFAPSVWIWQRVYVPNPSQGYAYAEMHNFRVFCDTDQNYSITDWAEPFFDSLRKVAESYKDIEYRGMNDKNMKRFVQSCVSAVMEGLYAYLDAGPFGTGSNQFRGKPVNIIGLDIPALDHPEEAFLLDEDDVYGNRLDPLLLGKDIKFHGYWRGFLTQHALLAACESFPKLNDNSISNIIEVVGFMKALVVDHKIEIPKSLSSLWLAYRYQYSTTKLDAEEAIKFVHRHMDLGTLDRSISCYGSCTREIEGVSVTCRCSIDIAPKNLDTLGKLWRALDTYGLTPDFYVVWDMTPFSFIADWFLPIGDIASTLDADAKYFSGEFYTLSNLCYSLSYTRELHGDGDSSVNVKCYTRWAGSVPSSLNSYYWLDAPSASSKTVWYRILDSASLIIGH
jgi:hypothetical protein